MSSSYFDFKQFRVCHDRCAMKVGTDGVLLGAWADVRNARRVLDIGAGSGLLALMVAQREQEAHVVGVEIDANAVEQARQNANASSFANRIEILQTDVREFEDKEGFDAILCNPPFYTEDTLPPESQRFSARNSHALPFGDLIKCFCRLINDGGKINVILPTSAEPQFTLACMVEGLYMQRMCRVKTTAHKAPKRTLITYSTMPCQTICFEEIVLQENGSRSADYSRLTADFYLDCPQSS